MDLTYLRLVLLLASLAGYILFLSRKGIEAAFAPALTVSAIGIAMFVAGVLNIMPQTAAVIFVGGLALAAMAAKGRARPDPHTLTVLGFFTLVIFLLSILYRNVAFNGPDDFSHWALVVKNMLVTDRLPSQGAIVYYQNYPTGTAGFVYFACKILGHSEPNMLRGQAVIIISGLCFLWAWVKKRHLLCFPLIALFTLYLILSIGSVRNMLVDVILTLLGTASFLMLVYYRAEPKKSALCCCLVLSYLAIVKNSSFFFIVLHLIPALYFVWVRAKEDNRRPTARELGRVIFFHLILPVAAYYLWDRHVDYAFDAGNMTRHSLSLPYLMETFSEKSLTDIRSIFAAFAYRSIQVGFEIPSFLIILGVWVLGCLLHYRKDRKTHPTELWCLLWGLVAFGAWMASLLAMYLFSMPYAEAIILGSYTRYVMTIATYLLCICFVRLLHQLDEARTLAVPAAVLVPVIACYMVFTVRGSIPSLYQNIPFRSNARDILNEIRADYQVPDDSTYYIICDGWDVYTRFVARYEFWTGNVFVEKDPLNPAEPEVLNACDHLLLLRQGEDVDQFLENLGLPQGERYYYLPDYR